MSTVGRSIVDFNDVKTTIKGKLSKCSAVDPWQGEDSLGMLKFALNFIDLKTFRIEGTEIWYQSQSLASGKWPAVSNWNMFKSPFPLVGL